MNSNESALQRLLESPRRRGIVIIATSLVALVAGLPAVDDYFALREARRQMLLSAADAKRQAAALPKFRRLARQRAESLGKWRSKAIGEESIHQFRSGLVETVRSAGCRLRRIDIDEPRRRAWRGGDRPWDTSAVVRVKGETPYRLRSQRVVVSVSGRLDAIASFLRQMDNSDKLIHTQSLTLRPTDSEREEVVLELALIVFDLERSGATATT